MVEAELFALFERTADAAWTVTERGEVCSWNRAAERMLGYSAREAVGKSINDLLDAHDDLATAALDGGSGSAVRHLADRPDGIPDFDLEVRTRSGHRRWINISTIIHDNRRSGRRLLVRLARDVSAKHQQGEAHERLLAAARDVVAAATDPEGHAPVEPLSAQEHRVLTLFASGLSATAVARKLRISAQTLRNHLHHINRKLRTHNRLEAVTHAQRRGLIS